MTSPTIIINTFAEKMMMAESRMQTLILCKQFPIREYSLAKALLKYDVCRRIDAAAFSDRVYFDVEAYQKQEPVFRRIHSFVGYSKDHSEAQSVEEVLQSLSEISDRSLEHIIVADRYLQTLPQDESEKRIVRLYEFLNKLISENCYDSVLGELSSASDLIAYYLCEKNNIPFIHFEHSRIPNHIVFTDIYDKRIDLKQTYNRYKQNGIPDETKKRLEEYYKSFLLSHQPDYMKYTDTSKWKNTFLKSHKDPFMQRIRRFLKSYKDDIQYSADFYPHFSKRLSLRIREKYAPVRSVVLKRFYSNVPKGKPFLFAPLHYQPEAAIDVLAPEYTDQYKWIEELSENIKSKYTLVVKEHPSMIGFRDAAFYKNLSGLQNVVLVDHRTPSIELIKKSVAVVTLTSTVGYEAIILDRPVFTFGNVFYNECDYVVQLSAEENISELIEKTISVYDKTSEEYQHNRDAFIAAVLDTLFTGNYNWHIKDPSVLSPDNMKTISEAIQAYHEKITNKIIV